MYSYMKKKIALLLCMIVCVFSLAGCGKEVTNEIITTDETAQSVANDVISFVQTFVENDLDGIDWDSYSQSILQSYGYSSPYDFPYYVQVKATDSYKKAMKEVGSLGEAESYKVTMSEEEVIVTVKYVGEKNDADIEIIMETKLPQSITVTSFAVNIDYTFGEKMENAALNTLMGMGMVFCVLILICLLISLFKFIPMLTAKKNKKTDAVDNTFAQIAEKEEVELADDLELVAVIAAAIAASEGASSTDGFVVRSIRKSNAKKWQNA